MEFDIGVGILIIFEEIYVKYFKGIFFECSIIKLYVYIGDFIYVFGQFNVSVRYKFQFVIFFFIVVVGVGFLFLGRNWFIEICLDWNEIFCIYVIEFLVLFVVI